MTPPLRDYQKTALEAVMNGVNYLGLEQGLGKTRILIEFAKSKGARRILVFCPASVRLAWEVEVPKWWPDAPRVVLVNKPTDLALQEGFFIISYDRMSRGEAFLDAILVAPKFDMAFCDEAHALKGSPSKTRRTKNIYFGARKNIERMIAASGTPAPNHAGELYTAFRALAPGKISYADKSIMSQVQFEDLYCKVDYKWFGGRQHRVIVGSQNIEQLRPKLKGFLLRMRKKDVLPELPPLDFTTVPVEPSLKGIDPEILAGLDDTLLEGMTDDEVMKNLNGFDTEVGRLRAAVGLSEAGLARLRLALGLSKMHSASDYLVDFLEESRTKIVVWGVHHVVIDTLMEKLAAFNPVKIDGRSSPMDRRFAVDSFLNKSSCRVFVGNIVAAGTGLTLIGPRCECSDVFFVESSYTPGENLQAAARVHRLGQKDGVLARVFTARRTIDDRIQSIIARKSKELAELFS